MISPGNGMIQSPVVRFRSFLGARQTPNSREPLTPAASSCILLQLSLSLFQFLLHTCLVLVLFRRPAVFLFQSQDNPSLPFPFLPFSLFPLLNSSQPSFPYPFPLQPTHLASFHHHHSLLHYAIPSCSSPPLSPLVLHTS